MATPLVTHSTTMALAILGPHHNWRQPWMYDATQDLVDDWRKARAKGNTDCFLGKEDLSSIATVLHGHLDPFATISGVFQGCVTDSNLFNVAVDFSAYRAVEKCPNCCLQRAHSIFGELTKVWSSSKIRISNKHALPVLSFGSKTWTLSVTSSCRLDVFHQNCPRDLYYSLVQAHH